MPLPASEEGGLLSVTGLKTDFHMGRKTIKAIREVSVYISKGECL